MLAARPASVTIRRVLAPAFVSGLALLAIAFATMVATAGETNGNETPSVLRQSLYHYRATVIAVHDGDTITVDLDLGFHVWKRGERIASLTSMPQSSRGTVLPKVKRPVTFSVNSYSTRR